MLRPYLPLINYPDTTFNKVAKGIIEKYFPNGDAHESIRDDKYTKNYFDQCEAFKMMLNGSSFIPVNADNAELIKQFETLNNLTINIYYLDKDAYDEKGKKKLHELWSAKYMTETKAKNMNPNNHLDFMLLRKIIKYEVDPKTKMNLPIYKYHYVWLMDAIELATNQRGRNPNTLQCIKCKEHFNARNSEDTKKMLYYHYKNNECVERTVKYFIPEDRN